MRRSETLVSPNNARMVIERRGDHIYYTTYANGGAHGWLAKKEDLIYFAIKFKEIAKELDNV